MNVEHYTLITKDEAELTEIADALESAEIYHTIQKDELHPGYWVVKWHGPRCFLLDNVPLKAILTVK